ncbi:hypothetical protein F5H01DRAFT_308648, partial [Linnemannia elongata]
MPFFFQGHTRQSLKRQNYECMFVSFVSPLLLLVSRCHCHLLVPTPRTARTPIRACEHKRQQESERRTPKKRKKKEVSPVSALLVCRRLPFCDEREEPFVIGLRVT